MILIPNLLNTNQFQVDQEVQDQMVLQEQVELVDQQEQVVLMDQEVIQEQVEQAVGMVVLDPQV
jgi:hypothetical protein